MWKDIKRQSRNIWQGYKKIGTKGTEDLEVKKRTVIAIVLLAFSAGIMTAGIMRGELFIVFTKAVHICLECIGLG